MACERALSVREAAAVVAVKAIFAQLGRPPSLKELQPLLGVGPSQAHDLVKGAARAGALVVVRRRGYRTQIRLRNPVEEIPTAFLKIELAAREAAGATEQLGQAYHRLAAAAKVPRPENEPEDSAQELAA